MRYFLQAVTHCYPGAGLLVTGVEIPQLYRNPSTEAVIDHVGAEDINNREL